ncbi:Stress-induced bacterial acidophilic repeat-containing protein [Cladophialophora immunda]|nr:Stress-induced bacterial acidophilic repeat-containing protein [Cladophialophora immunda]
MTDNQNPGNFANRPKEEVQEIASKGGQASHNSGFAGMDPDEQFYSIFERQSSANRGVWRLFSQRDIASQGGQASGGSFEKGSERAAEAGRKGGSATGSS